MLTTRLFLLIFLNFIILIRSDEHQVWSSSLHKLLDPPFASSLKPKYSLQSPLLLFPSSNVFSLFHQPNAHYWLYINFKDASDMYHLQGAQNASFKTLKMVHLHRKTVDMSIPFIYNCVHLAGARNWLHWSKMHGMDNFKIALMW
jgi:hypothetical protein